MRSPAWWEDLGNYCGKRLTVYFDVDGINNEMHQKYRRGVDLQTVLDNMEALSSGGGVVKAFTILFKHNQNYVKDIKDMLAIEPNVSYAASFLIQLKRKHGTWEKAIKHYHSSDPVKNKPYLNKVVNFWKQKGKKIAQAIKKPISSQKISKSNNKSISIKESQPYLFARIDKVNFFRKIFAEK